ncbi:MAG: tRNA (adenosine(37)-N6)-threonylcarbamoyltransferase complex ATPase subunit type 1 TsaE [Lachnospiraceae bacterium]|nr:tRNA (adenosine(37)-N6)-threonylcarbamoyltransferase complex ATPase subunit type 1 TsaE [Lachnospiraceae bacterium]
MVMESYSAEETFRLGEMTGGKLKPGAVICLDGDLGAGKTVFVKGVAKGLGITDTVCSPTFTILQEYRDGRMPLYHFDVYRIEDPEEMYEIGFDEYLYGEGVCLIEWAKNVAELIPDGALKITITKDLDKGLSYRKISIE